MTQVLITGATGKVGNAVARPLVARGEAVRALLRDPVAARASLPGEVELLAGDVVDREACRRAVAGVEAVFISHGIYEQRVRNPAIFDAVNAAGAEDVAAAAREAGVARIVHTSTYDVFDADRNGHLDERQLATAPKQTPYERSKQRAEELVLAAAGAGTEVVIVNPGMVYGPGPWRRPGSMPPCSTVCGADSQPSRAARARGWHSSTRWRRDTWRRWNAVSPASATSSRGHTSR